MQAALSSSTTRRTSSGQPVLADSAAAAKDLCVDSASLLRGQKSVSIVHNGSIYRLQATKLGKLILTK